MSQEQKHDNPAKAVLPVCSQGLSRRTVQVPSSLVNMWMVDWEDRAGWWENHQCSRGCLVSLLLKTQSACDVTSTGPCCPTSWWHHPSAGVSTQQGRSSHLQEYCTLFPLVPIWNVIWGICRIKLSKLCKLIIGWIWHKSLDTVFSLSICICCWKCFSPYIVQIMPMGEITNET